MYLQNLVLPCDKQIYLVNIYVFCCLLFFVILEFVFASVSTNFITILYITALSICLIAGFFGILLYVVWRLRESGRRFDG